jgi:tRNA pseudouridine38-40 synthase
VLITIWVLPIFVFSKIRDSLRYFIEIAYNGKNYHGWQRQPDAITIQETIEERIATLLRKPIQIVGAGRTDAGVHAKQMFAHFDVDSKINEAEFVNRLNAFLPIDIAIKGMHQVKDDAHARFDATFREYEYYIALNKNPFLQDFAYYLHHKPDVKQMEKATKMLFNYSDFQCFSRTHTDVKTYICEIKNASWEEPENDVLVFKISADRFLRNMVRAIVGTLLDVGYNKTTLEDFKNIIISKDRNKAGASVPAKGLFLTKIGYPEDIFN